MALDPQQAFANFIVRFNQLPPTRKLGILAAVAASIALIVGLMLWARAPEYRVLFSNLSERDAGTVVTTLQQMNVPYRTGPGGAILVPASQVYDLRFTLASQGIPRGGAVGFEIMDTAKLGMTQFQEQIAYQRALEGELARTIQALAPVESARVHLAIPKPSVFIRDKQKPSASVMAHLFAGRSLDPAQVNAIVHLVSSSVPELNPANITVIDQAGNLLSARNQGGSMQGLNTSQLDYLREIEAYYANRIEAIVVPIVGNGNVKSEVRADLDFSESEFTSETFKPNPAPENQAVRSQQSVLDMGAGAGAEGVPGAFSNRPPGPAAAPFEAPAAANAQANTQTNAQAGPMRRESTTNFELDKTIRHVREPLGRIKRLSVAVVVNYRPSNNPDNPQPAPLSDAELEKINNLVKEAMGFNAARGDTVNVVNAAFTDSQPETVDLPIWKDAESMALIKEILKNLLVFGLAFYLVFGVLRPLLRDLMKPVEAATPEGGAVALGGMSEAEQEVAAAATAEDSYAEHLRKTREFAKENPKVVAEIVKEWMNKE